MLHGPIEYYKCPGCGTILCKSFPAAFNNFTVSWSDGTIKEPLLNKSDLARCTTCSHLFWQSRQEVIYIQPWSYWSDLENGLCEPNPYPDADYASAPAVDEYMLALESGLADCLGDKIYLRKMVWWFFNDRVRKIEQLFHTEKEETQWRENCLALIALLETNRKKNLFTLAELYRNLGRFDECLQLLREVNNIDLRRRIALLQEACSKQQTEVISFGFF